MYKKVRWNSWTMRSFSYTKSATQRGAKISKIGYCQLPCSGGKLPHFQFEGKKKLVSPNFWWNLHTECDLEKENIVCMEISSQTIVENLANCFHRSWKYEWNPICLSATADIKKRKLSRQSACVNLFINIAKIVIVGAEKSKVCWTGLQKN